MREVLQKNKYNARPTEYKGIKFRSGLEAWWAEAFDSLGFTWEYEPLTFHYASNKHKEYKYKPDFFVNEGTIQYYVECKGYMRKDSSYKLKAYLYNYLKGDLPDLFITNKKDLKSLIHIKYWEF